LALFGHKITLYRFNQGAHTIAGAQIAAGGSAPLPPHFNHYKQQRNLLAEYDIHKLTLLQYSRRSFVNQFTMVRKVLPKILSIYEGKRQKVLTILRPYQEKY